jgi:hypothetical protein
MYATRKTYKKKKKKKKKKNKERNETKNESEEHDIPNMDGEEKYFNE